MELGFSQLRTTFRRDERINRQFFCLMTHLQPEPISQQRLDHQPYLLRLFLERELLQVFGYRALFFRLDVELFGIDPTRPSRELIV